MAREQFWRPRGRGMAAEFRERSTEELWRGVVRAAAPESAMRERLSTPEGLSAYVEEQLRQLPDGWGWVAHPEEGDGCFWNIQPSEQDTFDAGYDLVAFASAGLFLLTHSNRVSGAWTRGRMTGGTVASFLEFEALIQEDFDPLEFVEYVTSHFRQNHDYPT